MPSIKYVFIYSTNNIFNREFYFEILVSVFWTSHFHITFKMFFIFSISYFEILNIFLDFIKIECKSIFEESKKKNFKWMKISQVDLSLKI